MGYIQWRKLSAVKDYLQASASAVTVFRNSPVDLSIPFGPEYLPQRYT
jgi:hypothetical protein